MSVLKSKRKPSQFEVFHHLNKVRKEVTDLLLRDFGYSKRKAAQRLEKKFSGRSYEELTDVEKEIYDHFRKQQEAFDTWFIEDERKAVVDCLRSIGEHVYTANSIYPTYYEELVERRVHQDLAIGQCYRLVQELQYAIETLPVDVNSFLRFGEDIQREIDLTDTGRVIHKIHPKRLTGMRRKAKKLVLILSEKDFDDWFRSWFNGHCHYMSKLQRSNMLDLCKKLKEEHYYGKTDFS